MTLRRPSCHRRPIAQRNCFVSRRPFRRWRFSSLLGRRWEYHTLSWRHQKNDALSMRIEYDTLSAARWEYDALSVRACSRADAGRVSYSQQAALAENINFFVTNWYYFSFLTNSIALKQSTRTPTAPLTNCASYLASPPSSPHVVGWLLNFFCGLGAIGVFVFIVRDVAILAVLIWTRLPPKQSNTAPPALPTGRISLPCRACIYLVCFCV